MTGITLVREDGTDIPIKNNLGRRRLAELLSQCGGTACDQNGDQEVKGDLKVRDSPQAHVRHQRLMKRLGSVLRNLRPGQSDSSGSDFR